MAKPGIEQLPERLRECARAVGSGDELARRSEIPRRTLETYFTGQSEPSLERLWKIAKAANVNLTWLITGTGPLMPDEDRLEDDDSERISEIALLGGKYTLLPRYDVTAAAGAGIAVASEQIVDYLAFKTDWIVKEMGWNPRELLLIGAIGDSMQPGINEGDILLVYRADARVRDNAVYVIAIDGDLIVKRIHRRVDGRVVISSDNPAYPPEEIPADESGNINVVGRVVWVGGRV